jgi:nitrogenase-associated protein
MSGWQSVSVRREPAATALCARHVAIVAGDNGVVQVTFFEKPGCANNTRQKQWLRERGVVVVAIDLLDHTWSEGELLAFFTELPVSDWFNRSAPRIKAGEVIPEQLSRDEALRVLLQDPLLIRRPLLRKGDERRIGFESSAIAHWLGIRGSDESTSPAESCPRSERPCSTEEERA